MRPAVSSLWDSRVAMIAPSLWPHTTTLPSSTNCRPFAYLVTAIASSTRSSRPEAPSDFPLLWVFLLSYLTLTNPASANSSARPL